MKSFTATHWGIYEVVHEGGETVGLKAFDRAPDPSPIGLSMLDAIKGPLRVRAPSVRRSCCLLYTSPSPRDRTRSRMPSSA